MAHIGRPHAAVPYANTNGGGEANTGPLIQDPPNSGLYVPDTSQIDDED
ncbi:hypothetical protein ACRCUN_06375 [Mycobacterium sp. LTG2003]